MTQLDRSLLQLADAVDDIRFLLTAARESIVQHRSAWNAAPILATMSAGMELLLKVTVGLLAVEDDGKWPDERTMRRVWGHDIVTMDQHCRRRFSELNGPAYAGQISRALKQNAVSMELVNIAARYATQGRFYSIDQLGDTPPDRESYPSHLWEAMESRLLQEHDLLVGFVTGEEPGQGRLNRLIADGLLDWWLVYQRAWQHGLPGERAKVWSANISMPWEDMHNRQVERLAGF